MYSICMNIDPLIQYSFVIHTILNTFLNIHHSERILNMNIHTISNIDFLYLHFTM